MIGKTPKGQQMYIFEAALKYFIAINHKQALLSKSID